MARNIEDAIRKATQATTVLDMKHQDPTKTYALVRYDEKYDPHSDNIKHYLQNGWTIEHSDQAVQDDRPSSPSHDKADKLRKSPVTFDGKGECKYVRMSKDTVKLQEDRAKREIKEKRDFIRKTGTAQESRGRLDLRGSELNESNINNISED